MRLKRAIAIVALSLFIVSSLFVNVGAASQKWVCKPGWGNWKHTVTHHKGYTTTSFIFTGKIMIPINNYWPPYDEHDWTCKNWIKEQDLVKYDKNGNLLKNENR